ncbi:hypothetical protein STAFG_1398 [Streptomyces afghaniensis 772]|uniref:Uncharacterized protein n=1 Tax=Streptomyces afghaniensis 772 TaxID=1283301 RepID=S4MZF5_9ACTN|nr:MULTISPECIES: hypothetical protein [Streptomyces]EPJ41555.1 hypothetical protein STAFG_1398 [Streptomyces afghaniensis 772]UOB12813.1 hypothetical protein MQE23_28835 [Streptomyces sp. HP-A2021]
MLNSKKIAATAAAGVLGSLALIGAGTAQAAAQGGPGKCVDDGRGQIRCVQGDTYKITTAKDGTVRFANESTQTCPTSHSQVTCVSNVVVPGKQS